MTLAGKLIGLIAVFALLSAPPAMAGKKRGPEVALLKGQVFAQPYPAKGGKTAVPLVLDKASAKASGMKARIGILLVEAGTVKKLPRGTVKTRLLRLNDRINAKALVRPANRSDSYWRIPIKTLTVVARSSTLSAAELQALVEKLREDLDALYDFTNSLTSFTATSIQSLRADIANLRADLTALQADVASLKTQLTALKAQVDALSADLGAKVNDLLTRVTALESLVNNATTGLGAVNTTINSLSSTVTGVTNTVSKLLLNITNCTDVTSAACGTAVNGAVLKLQQDTLAVIQEINGTADAALIATTRLDAATTNISTLQGNVTTINTSITNLQNADTTLTNNLNTANTNITNAQNSITGINTALFGSGSIASPENNSLLDIVCTDLRGSVNTLIGNVDALDAANALTLPSLVPACDLT